MHQDGGGEPDDDELRLLLAAGSARMHAGLVAAFGSAAAVIRASVRELAAMDGMGPARALALRRRLDRADPCGERRALVRVGARLVRRGDSGYPSLLASIVDPPPALWVRGDLSPLAAACVAIVGSRRCTLRGSEQALRLALGLAECGFTVVSGGARGIDAAAHRGALRGRGATVAVLGCGLGCCYPAEHGDLFESIAASGALLSELPVDTPPRPASFPRRNRIVSGLSLGVVVVEAGVRSGALITAREAVESQHREVMAYPGPVDSPVSAGCHLAIREGWAGLVTGLEDVLAQVEQAGTLLSACVPRDPADAAILGALAGTPAGLGADALARAADLPIPRLMAILTRLQIEGKVNGCQGRFRLRALRRGSDDEGTPSPAAEGPFELR